jgi:hypothetical protein
MAKEGLNAIFDSLKTLLSMYEGESMLKNELYGRYELEFDKEITTRSRKTGNVIRKKSLYFAAIIVQKDYVGLYFMPIYSHRAEFDFLSDGFMKTLKGKTCFHIKKLDKPTENEIKRMLKKGYGIYKNADTFT